MTDFSLETYSSHIVKVTVAIKPKLLNTFVNLLVIFLFLLELLTLINIQMFSTLALNNSKPNARDVNFSYNLL